MNFKYFLCYYNKTLPKISLMTNNDSRNYLKINFYCTDGKSTYCCVFIPTTVNLFLDTDFVVSVHAIFCLR